MDWSRDGRFLLFRSTDAKTRDHLWALPLIGDKTPIALTRTEFDEEQAQLSPDSRWLAYTCNESGRNEVYVQFFAPGSVMPGKWQVSTAGGTQPRWRSDGKELFYVARDGKLMAVEVKVGVQGFNQGKSQALFELRSDTDAGNPLNWGYVPSSDGKRFLIATTAGERGEAPPLNVVVNWLVGVKK
jgi:hypothetical protein